MAGSTLSLPLRRAAATMNAIARNLAAALDRAKARDPDLNQARLADLVGVSEATVARWLNGKRTPLMESLKKLADALGVQVSELVEEAQTPRTRVQERMLDLFQQLPEAEQEAFVLLLESRKPR